jgi:hypothetical protein
MAWHPRAHVPHVTKHSISRSHSQFNIDILDRCRAPEGSRDQRLMLDDTDAHQIPPSRFHVLSQAGATSPSGAVSVALTLAAP